MECRSGSHVLTVENQEHSRKKAIKEKEEAAVREAEREKTILLLLNL